MSLKDYALLRGTQQNVGDLVVQVPGSRPKTDAEIVDHELLIAEVDQAADDARAVVKLAKTIMAGLRDGIQTTSRRRRDGIKEEAELFDGQPQAGDLSTTTASAPLLPGERVSFNPERRGRGNKAIKAAVARRARKGGV